MVFRLKNKESFEYRGNQYLPFSKYTISDVKDSKQFKKFLAANNIEFEIETNDRVRSTGLKKFGPINQNSMSLQLKL